MILGVQVRVQLLPAQLLHHLHGLRHLEPEDRILEGGARYIEPDPANISSSGYGNIQIVLNLYSS